MGEAAVIKMVIKRVSLMKGKLKWSDGRGNEGMVKLIRKFYTNTKIEMKHCHERHCDCCCL
jgi:hypothetical protein